MRKLMAAGAVWLVIAAALQAQNVKRTTHAVIDCDKITFNWTTGKFEFSGSAKITLKAPRGDATITSPSVTGQGDLKANMIREMVAAGPVTFDVLTKGTRKLHVVATCRRQATYSEETGVVVLEGSARAVIKEVPTTPETQPSELRGEQIRINMKTGELTVSRGAHFEGEIPEKTSTAAKEPGGPKKAK